MDTTEPVAHTAIDAREALIWVMVVVSAADRDMTDEELRHIGDVVRTMPAFRNFSEERIIPAARNCALALQPVDGMEQVLFTIDEALPPRLRETAYLLACELAAADQAIEREEMRILRHIRTRLGIDPLVAVALERAAIARRQNA